MGVELLLVVAHYYLCDVCISSKFCSHDVIIELGHHMLENCFGVHIFSLMKSLDILQLHEILWPQENIEPVVVFSWCWNVKHRLK